MNTLKKNRGLILLVLGISLLATIAKMGWESGGKPEEIAKVVDRGTIKKVDSQTTTQKQGESESDKAKKAKTVSGAGTVFAWLLLLILLGVAGYQLVTKNGRDPGRITSSPTAMALAMVIAVNVFAAIGVPEWWVLFWEKHTLFFLINFGVILAVHFGSQGTLGKVIAYSIAMIVVASLLKEGATTFKEMEKSDSNKASAFGSPSKGVSRSMLAQYKEVPLEVARRVICECESGCEQFEKDRKGNFLLDKNGQKIPLKNKGIPEKGIPPSSAFGKYQFIEAHREVAKKLGFDLNTEEGQDQYFDHVYPKQGFAPWNFVNEEHKGGPVCWGPKLVAQGYNPSMIAEPQEATVFWEAPAGKFGSAFKIRASTDVSWVATGKTRARNQLGLESVYGGGPDDPTHIPPPSTSLAFKSESGKPTKVTLTLTRR